MALAITKTMHRCTKAFTQNHDLLLMLELCNKVFKRVLIFMLTTIFKKAHLDTATAKKIYSFSCDCGFVANI